ncbi:MAG: hypothetical protein KA712_24555 [Myxococcales bacterium]|nr:hypothetical protein [Myxococcales bacterium]
MEIRVYVIGAAGQVANVALTGFVLRGDITPAPAAPAAKRKDLGTNLGHVRDFETDSPFLDKFKHARPWLTRAVGTVDVFDRQFSEQVPVDADGWPTQVPFSPAGHPPQIVHTVLSTPRNGPHALLFEGKGKMVVKGPGVNAPVTAAGGPGRWDVVINKRGNSYRDAATIYVEIHETDPADPIRKLRFMHAGHVAVYETAPFEPLMIARLAGMTPIRFMDWGNTNRQPLAVWADRPKPSTYSQATNKGVALEHMIALVNATKADAWINVPHLANDAFVREMAKMLLAQLHPAGKVYVEYSNETWNTEFDQGKYVSTESKVKYPGLRADLAHQKFATYKQVHVWELFKEVFGAQFEARIRRPLGGQAASGSVNKARLEYAEASDVNPQGIKVQGLALAPYFGKVYRNSDVAGGIPTTAQLLQDAKSDITQRRKWCVGFSEATGQSDGCEAVGGRGRPDHPCGRVRAAREPGVRG